MFVKGLIVVIIFAVIGLTEIVPLAKAKKKKELVLYSVFFAGAFVLSMLYTLGVPLPQISKGVNAVIDAIFQTNIGQ